MMNNAAQTNSYSDIDPDLWQRGVVDTVANLKKKRGALLPILHAVQDEIGYIPPAAIDYIGKALNQTAAEIYGVVSFYHQFHTSPGGAHQVEICRAEACQAMGSRALEAHAKDSLGIDYHQSTSDREIRLEPVYCLGNCACAPSVRIDDKIYARVTPERFDRLVESVRTKSVEVK